jgi:hypothetical protein
MAGFPPISDSPVRDAPDWWSFSIQRICEEWFPGVAPDLPEQIALILSNPYGLSGWYENFTKGAPTYGGESNTQRLVAIGTRLAAIEKTLAAIATKVGA